MTITEATRHQLHQALITKLGEEEATTLMEHLPPVGWADVATNASLAAGFALVRSEMAAESILLRSELASHREHTDSEFALVRAEMASHHEHTDSEFALVRAEMASGFALVRTEAAAESTLIRAEMATGFARSDERMLAMHNSQLRWMIGTMVASYGIIAAVAGLLR